MQYHSTKRQVQELYYDASVTNGILITSAFFLSGFSSLYFFGIFALPNIQIRYKRKSDFILKEWKEKYCDTKDTQPEGFIFQNNFNY